MHLPTVFNNVTKLNLDGLILDDMATIKSLLSEQFETSYHDAVALMKLWHAKGDVGKAVEIFDEYKCYPRFLQLTGPELVREMTKTQLYT